MTHDQWWAICPVDASNRTDVMCSVLAAQKWHTRTGWGSELLDWWEAKPLVVVQDGERAPSNDSTWAPVTGRIAGTVGAWLCGKAHAYTPRDL